MIQRIQTVYLLLVFSLMLTLFFVPFAQFLGDGEQFQLTAWGIQSLTESGAMVLPTTYMGVLLTFCTALPLVTIFLYRWRWVQIRLCIVEMVFLVGQQVYMTYYICKMSRIVNTATTHSVNYSLVDVLPVVCLVLIFFAYRGVVKDETLIKSLNRIR